LKIKISLKNSSLIHIGNMVAQFPTFTFLHCFKYNLNVFQVSPLPPPIPTYIHEAQPPLTLLEESGGSHPFFFFFFLQAFKGIPENKTALKIEK
jgi:hypothetical protein